MQDIFTVFNEPKGASYHGGALLYTAVMSCLGSVGLFSANWVVNIVSMCCLAHGMTIAAYMIHEASHNTVFRTNEANAKLGVILTWVCGASYGTFQDIRYKHFRHHVDNDDVVWFDYTKFFRQHPIFTKIVQVLEYLYIPAHDLLMHFIMVFSSFCIPQRRDQRARNVKVICIRGGIFVSILYLYPKAAILYAIAYMIMMQILRFMDSLQHDYGYHLTLFSDEPAPLKGDFAYEQAHTFSNPHTLQPDWINWLTLNFGYHNAHHARPVVPWYELPNLHRQLYGTSQDRVIPLSAQLKICHRFRVERVTLGEASDDADEELLQEQTDFLQAAKLAKVPGGNAASFLTAF